MTETDFIGLPDSHAAEAVTNGLAALDLEQLSDTLFVGDSLPMPGGRVFGGQVLAQALIAAGRTVEPDRQAHSLHGYFLRPGDAANPITFEVEELRDGNSFSARRTHAFQNGKPILSMIASFQVDQPGPEHSVRMPEVPRPEEVKSGIEVMTPLAGHPAADFWLKQAPFDVRHIEGSVFVTADKKPKAAQHVWMKVRQPLEVDELTHRALIAFGSDSVVLEPLLRKHQHSWASPDLRYASLDHAMWWHRPARADEWLLFVQDSPTAQGSRGLNGAWVFAENGELVASLAQEGMFRISD